MFTKLRWSRRVDLTQKSQKYDAKGQRLHCPHVAHHIPSQHRPVRKWQTSPLNILVVLSLSDLLTHLLQRNASCAMLVFLSEMRFSSTSMKNAISVRKSPVRRKSQLQRARCPQKISVGDWLSGTSTIVRYNTNSRQKDKWRGDVQTLAAE